MLWVGWGCLAFCSCPLAAGWVGSRASSGSIIPRSEAGAPGQQTAAGLIGMCRCCRSEWGGGSCASEPLGALAGAGARALLAGVASRRLWRGREAAMFLSTWRTQKMSRKLLQRVRTSRHFNLHVLVGELEQGGCAE